MLPQLPPPGPFPVWEPEALFLGWHPQFGWWTGNPWEEARCSRLHRLWGFPLLTAWSVLAASSSFHWGNTVTIQKMLSQKTGKHVWNLYLVLQMSFVTSLAPHLCQVMLVTLGHHLPPLSWALSWRLEQKPVFSTFCCLYSWPRLSCLPAGDGRCPY